MWGRPMLRRAAWLLIPIALVFSLETFAGTINRGTKAGSGTDWVDGEVLTAAELNTDMNEVFDEFNGNIEDINVKAAAGIDPTKVDDYSTNAAESQTQTDPSSLATDLSEEIAQLRYAIHQLSQGMGNTTRYWSDTPAPPRTDNLVLNGGFEINPAADADAAGWTGTNATRGYADASEDSEGGGMAASITATAISGQIAQTLGGLKPSTEYEFRARVKPTTGDSCTLRITGGAVPVTDATLADGAFETLTVTATTNSTPDDLVVELESDANTDVCEWDHVSAHERAVDQIARTGGYVDFTEDSTETALDGTTWDYSITAEVTVPGPGYYIRVLTSTCAADASTTTALEGRITENVDGGGASTVVSVSGNDASNANAVYLTPFYYQTNPTPGSTYQYAVELRGSTAWNANDTGTGACTSSSIAVELVRGG